MVKTKGSKQYLTISNPWLGSQNSGFYTEAGRKEMGEWRDTLGPVWSLCGRGQGFWALWCWWVSNFYINIINVYTTVYRLYLSYNFLKKILKNRCYIWQDWWWVRGRQDLMGARHVLCPLSHLPDPQNEEIFKWLTVACITVFHLCHKQICPRKYYEC